MSFFQLFPRTRDVQQQFLFDTFALVHNMLEVELVEQCELSNSLIHALVWNPNKPYLVISTNGASKPPRYDFVLMPEAAIFWYSRFGKLAFRRRPEGSWPKPADGVRFELNMSVFCRFYSCYGTWLSFVWAIHTLPVICTSVDSILIPMLLLDYNTAMGVLCYFLVIFAKWCFLSALKSHHFSKVAADLTASRKHDTRPAAAQIGHHFVVNINGFACVTGHIGMGQTHNPGSPLLVNYTVIPDNHWLSPSLSIINHP